MVVLDGDSTRAARWWDAVMDAPRYLPRTNGGARFNVRKGMSRSGQTQAGTLLAHYFGGW